MPALPLGPADLWLFFGSFLGLWLVPAALGRAVWIFPAAFATLGIFLLAAPATLHPAHNVWTWLLLSQAPWLLLVPDLLARGQVARALDSVPLRALLAWSLLHLIGVRHVFSALHGSLSPEVALGIAAGELITVAGALFLWLAYRPEKTWFRIVALFWNTHALFTSLDLSTRLARAHAGLTVWSDPSPEIHLYFATWPGSLEAFFWIPLAIGLHAAVFYKLLYTPSEARPARPEAFSAT
jgi:hypothetical protein